MKSKFTNSQAFAMHHALLQRGGFSSLDDGASAALYLSQHASTLGKLKVTPELLERVSKGIDEGDLIMDPICPYYSFNNDYRCYSTAFPISFSAFNGIRRSNQEVSLTPAQEENVMKSFEKIIKGEDGSKDISVSLPFVSAFFDQRCPELRSGTLSSSRGATYLLLSVITGNKELCLKCLNAGANPNSMLFLRDESAPPEDMTHGYSPMFMAVLAEQIELLDLLSSYGGSIHCYDRWGRTMLHAAMELCSTEVVEWLLQKGAPLYIPNCMGLMPADRATDLYSVYRMPILALEQPFPQPPARYLMGNNNNSTSSSANQNHNGNHAHQNNCNGSSGADTADSPPKTPNSEEEETKLTAAAAAASVPESSSEDKGCPTTSSKGIPPPPVPPLSSSPSASPSPASASSPLSSSAATATTTAAPNRMVPCHCRSGRPRGYCGCIDDMTLRWGYDRLATEWSLGVDFYAVAKKEAAAEEERRRIGQVTASSTARGSRK